MHPVLTVIEDELGHMFQPEFAKAILSKQLADINQTREGFTDANVEVLLDRIENKVLVSFYGDKAKSMIADIKRKIRDLES